MRLPLVSNIVPGGANALLQQMLTNKILGAQAQYAYPQQQAITNQEIGQGQNALAQGQFAPQLQSGLAQQEQAEGNILAQQVPFAGQQAQGNALSALGIGQQEQVAGIHAQPLASLTLAQQAQAAQQAGLTTQQMQIITNRMPQMTLAELIRMQSEATISRANANVAPAAASANVLHTLNGPYATAVAHPTVSAGIWPVTNAILSGVKNTAATLGNGAGSVLTGGANNENGSSGTIDGMPYTNTRIRNQRMEYWIPGHGWSKPPQ